MTSIVDHHGGTKRETKGGKHKHLKLFMHPPSIPTRFQTFHFDDHEPKGFNSSSPRFDQNLDELPGPGYYNSSSTESEESNQLKALVGFTSTVGAESLVKIQDTADNSSVTYSVSHSVSSSFRKNIAKIQANSMFGPGGHVRTPGPGSYEAHDALSALTKKSSAESGANFVFKSRTARSDINNPESTPGRDAPAPGSYDIKESGNSVAGATAAFKATMRSDMLTRHFKNMPGPGSYELLHKPSQYSPKRPYKYKSVVSLDEDSSFGRSPSPPGPGQYELADAADKIHPASQAPKGIFASKTPRFSNLANSIPGPGFYRPLHEGRSRSFHLNLQQTWT
ncbi:O(6)-methylguanine-induced apoptosis 2 [Blyttiomyces sp. JEL0837]|nr:O(6)-methylguanine-induced apoptosis 2 [Blyttiomyces sp. JEL0837]